MNLSNSVLITRIFINGVMLNLNFVNKYEKKNLLICFELPKKIQYKINTKEFERELFLWLVRIFIIYI